jgi:short subunit dehydrogenase-like uncharacterized protein
MNTKTYTETPDGQTKMSKIREKNTYSQTSWLRNPEGLQLHHNHETFLFLTVLLLFEVYQMRYW